MYTAVFLVADARHTHSCPSPNRVKWYSHFPSFLSSIPPLHTAFTVNAYTN